MCNTFVLLVSLLSLPAATLPPSVALCLVCIVPLLRFALFIIYASNVLIWTVSQVCTHAHPRTHPCPLPVAHSLVTHSQSQTQSISVLTVPLSQGTQSVSNWCLPCAGRRWRRREAHRCRVPLLSLIKNQYQSVHSGDICCCCWCWCCFWLSWWHFYNTLNVVWVLRYVFIASLRVQSLDMRVQSR